MKKFINEKADINNPKWNNLIHREKEIYKRENDLRSDFERDYNRILHSNAYKRMKHKTQVFFSPTSDHICTRMEHVSHVDSISYTISNTLGLNTELTKAISIGHDLGHAPFGHQGERILSEISKKYIGDSFWHEKNGVNIVDNIELLEDCNSNFENMNLTYAVRDGIISHCGEIDENCIKPRNGYIDLNNYTYPNQYSPYTWEGCVVKISDKISYIIRDIEDAIYLHIIDNHFYGKISFARNSMLLESRREDKEQDSAGYTSIKCVALDYAMLSLGIDGSIPHPRFLLHDSPKESDMGDEIYHSLFEYVKSMEDSFANKEPSFQYIITTTAPPPEKFQQEPYLINPVLDAAIPEKRLLGIDL